MTAVGSSAARQLRAMINFAAARARSREALCCKSEQYTTLRSDHAHGGSSKTQKIVLQNCVDTDASSPLLLEAFSICMPDQVAYPAENVHQTEWNAYADI